MFCNALVSQTHALSARHSGPVASVLGSSLPARDNNKPRRRHLLLLPLRADPVFRLGDLLRCHLNDTQLSSTLDLRLCSDVGLSAKCQLPVHGDRGAHHLPSQSLVLLFLFASMSTLETFCGPR